MTEPNWADVRKRNDHTRAHLTPDELGTASPTHGEDGEPLIFPRRYLQSLPIADCPIIAPVCATCTHEIDKNEQGWFHVAAARHD